MFFPAPLFALPRNFQGEGPSNLTDGAPFDSALVKRARQGDAEAFGRLVEATLGRTWALAWRLLGSQDGAEDLVQETYVKAFRSIGKFRAEAGFTSWLYRIEFNCYLDGKKKAAIERRVDLDGDASGSGAAPLDPRDGAMGILERLESKENAELLRRALEALEPSQREILCLRTFEDLSYEELAAALDVPVGTVGTWLYRAREAFREAYLRLAEVKK